MKTFTVAEVMNRGVITCQPDAPLDEVARILSDAEISAVVVVTPEGRMEGLISQFDLLKHYGAGLEGKVARDIMTTKPVLIAPGDDVENAAQTMLDRQIHRLIVTEETRAIGVLSVSDIIRLMRYSPEG